MLSSVAIYTYSLPSTLAKIFCSSASFNFSTSDRSCIIPSRLVGRSANHHVYHICQYSQISMKRRMELTHHAFHAGLAYHAPHCASLRPKCWSLPWFAPVSVKLSSIRAKSSSSCGQPSPEDFLSAACFFPSSATSFADWIANVVSSSCCGPAQSSPGFNQMSSLS